MFDDTFFSYRGRCVFPFPVRGRKFDFLADMFREHYPED